MGIVINSDIFKPFNTAPYLLVQNNYNTTYNAEREIYDTLTQKMGDLESAVLGSEKSKGIYDAYMKQLLEAADEFSKGRNSTTARKLSNLRSLYGSLIKKLENARDRMMSVVKSRADRVNLQDGYSMLYEDLGNLDNYLDDPTYQPKGISGLLIANLAGNLSSIFAELYSKAEKEGRLQGFTNLFVNYYGKRPEEIMNTLTLLNTGGTVSKEDLKIIIDMAINTSGIKDFKNYDSNPQLQKLALYWAALGLIKSVGKSTPFTVVDDIAKMNYENYLAEQRAEKAAEREIIKQAAKNALSGNDDDDVSSFMQNSDILNIARDSSKAKSNYEYIMKNFGLLKDDISGKINTKKVAVAMPLTLLSYNRDVNITSQVRYKEYDLFFSNSGKLMPKSTFVSLGKTPEEKSYLRNYYDKTVLPYLKIIGYENINDNTVNLNNMPTFNDVSKSADAYLNREGALRLRVLRANQNNNQKAFKDAIVSRINNNGGIYDISEGFNNDYTLLSKTDASELSGTIDDDLSYYLSFEHGLLGLVISTGGKQYFLPKDAFSSVELNAWNINLQKIELLNERMEYLRLLYLSKTITDEEFVLQMSRAQDAAKEFGAAATKQILKGIFGNYDVKSDKIE